MSKTLAVTALVTGLGMGLVGNANATHASGGLDWSLSYSGVAVADTDPTHDTYLIKLGLDTDGYTGHASFLDQVALKTFAPITDISLVNASSGAGSWNLNLGGLSGGGCNGHGGGSACLNSLDSLNGGKGLSLTSSNGQGVDDYSWTFRVTVDNTKPYPSWAPEAIVLARMVDDNGAKVGPLGVGPLNLAVAAVPEPGTYAMMLAGLGMVGTVVRRRCKDTI
jgi:hypothetical protein